MALGFTQPPTEMSTRNNNWGKGGRCVGLTISPHSCADCLEMWEPQPSGTLRACSGLFSPFQACNGIALLLPLALLRDKCVQCFAEDRWQPHMWTNLVVASRLEISDLEFGRCIYWELIKSTKNKALIKSDNGNIGICT
jgi:hypothetical protein